MEQVNAFTLHWKNDKNGNINAKNYSFFNGGKLNIHRPDLNWTECEQ